MQFERANLEIDGPVAVLRMNDPDVLNALSPGMIKGMTDALDFLAAAETPARCLVLTGTGRAFSTGANLQGRGKDGITRGAGQTWTIWHWWRLARCKNQYAYPAHRPQCRRMLAALCLP